MSPVNELATLILWFIRGGLVLVAVAFIIGIFNAIIKGGQI